MDIEEFKELEAGCKVFVYGFPGKVVRIIDGGADIEVAGEIQRYYEPDEIEKDDERTMQHTRDSGED